MSRPASLGETLVAQCAKAGRGRGSIWRERHFVDPDPLCLGKNGCFQKIGVAPKWMVYNGRPLWKMDDVGVITPIFGNTQK